MNRPTSARLILVVFTAMLTLAVPAPAAVLVAQPAVQPEQSPPPNAALRYWRALSLFEGAFSEKVQECYKGKDTVVTPEVRALLTKNANVVAEVIKAASMDRCDFEVDYDEGFMAILPHLGRLRGAARLLAVDAVANSDDPAAGAKPDAVAERLAAIFGLARHSSSDKLLISSLVAVAIAELGKQNVERLNDKLTEAGRAKILAAIAKFDRDDPFAMRASVEMEGKFTLGYLRALADRPDARERIAEMASLVGEAHDAASPLALMDPATIKMSCDQAARFYVDALRAWDSPDAPAQLDRLLMTAANGGYGAVAKVVCPAMGKVRTGNNKGVAALARARDVLSGAAQPEPAGAPTPK